VSSSIVIVYVIVIGAFLLFMSRSGRKRQAQAAQIRNAATIGAEVRTIGGMVGEVIELTDEYVVIETTPGIRLRFVKSAIAGVVPPAVEFDSADEEDSDEDDADEDAASETGVTAEASADGVSAVEVPTDVKDGAEVAATDGVAPVKG
jgi:preprotein translocase subunit YajC